MTRPPVSDATIRRVLDQRDVRIVYQPVVNLKTREVFAYEALCRPPQGDFDGPLSLFAAAVEHSCTGQLGRMLREMSLVGCPSHRLFINIHPAELNEKWLVQPDDPIFNHDHDVYLEITEAVPLSHYEHCHGVLKEIRGRGIMLAVDDLGAGYSNLKYIADLAPQVVKLDRQLIADLRAETRLQKLVTALVKLCDSLGAKVVAEGIETLEEMHAVIDTGAHFGQGYLFARPDLPAPKVDWKAITIPRPGK